MNQIVDTSGHAVKSGLCRGAQSFQSGAEGSLLSNGCGKNLQSQQH